MSKRIKYTAAGLVILLAGLGGAGYLYRKHQGRDIRGCCSHARREGGAGAAGGAIKWGAGLEEALHCGAYGPHS